jgi:hypothetical protein
MSEFERKLQGRAHSANVSVGQSLIKQTIRQELQVRSAAEQFFRNGSMPSAILQHPQGHPQMIGEINAAVNGQASRTIQVPQVVSVQPPVVSELNATAKP